MLTPLDLHSENGGEILARIRGSASASVAAIAERLERIFAITSPFAPQFKGVGGLIALDPDQAAAYGAARVSVTGNGESVEVALVSCLAEAADFLSQLERRGDIAATGRACELPGAVAEGWIADMLDAHPVDWISARDAATGAAALLPADLCLRREPSRRRITPPGPLSSGAAAGPSFEAAAMRAVLELCERDAVALWWHGGRRGRGFPLEHEATRAAAALIARLRGGAADRRAWILDITAVEDVPVVAAVSIDQTGYGLACGTAARCDVVEAAEAAVLEMCQMELAAPLAAAKCEEAGEAALNEADWRHLRRAAFDTTNCQLLWPRGTAPQTMRTAPNLDQLIANLHARDLPMFLLELTRADIDVHVVRAVSPALQPFSPTVPVATQRLRHALKESGGAASTQGVPLM
jgi:ribosomal protein S12 methylthiotransferase accessory factor